MEGTQVSNLDPSASIKEIGFKQKRNPQGRLGLITELLTEGISDLRLFSWNIVPLPRGNQQEWSVGKCEQQALHAGQVQSRSFALQIFPVMLIKTQSWILGSQYCTQKLFPVFIILICGLDSSSLSHPPLFIRFIPASAREARRGSRAGVGGHSRALLELQFSPFLFHGLTGN